MGGGGEIQTINSLPSRKNVKTSEYCLSIILQRPIFCFTRDKLLGKVALPIRVISTLAFVSVFMFHITMTLPSS